MSAALPDAVFVPSASGRILVTFYRPRCDARHTVLLVPPFGDEMNKSRAMLARMGQLLAARGIATALPDLFGTGDSDGEFSDATWETWRADLASTVRWAADALAPVRDLLAVRLGAALAADASNGGQLPRMKRSVLWQPVFDRARFLTQFLRLRTAAAAATDDRPESVEELRRQLLAGSPLEIAGYELSTELGRALAEATPFAALPEIWGSVSWMEIGRSPDAQIAPPSRALVDATKARGNPVDTWMTTGEPFWMATEIVINDALLKHSIEVLAA